MLKQLRLFVKEYGMEIVAIAAFTVLVNLAANIYFKSLEPNISNAGKTQLAALVVFLAGIGALTWAFVLARSTDKKKEKEREIELSGIKRFMDMNAPESGGQYMDARKRNEEMESRKRKESGNATS
jgi:hypothetical protein